jgi:hypothetical protein
MNASQKILALLYQTDMQPIEDMGHQTAEADAVYSPFVYKNTPLV